MTIYTCSRKRMVVNKFSNRPPFELKPNESSVTSKNSEKFRKSLESINKSYNSIIKQLDHIELDQARLTEINTTNKNIPKIIESFQKITPKREVIIVRNRNYLSSQDSSVQTIFRNKNSNNFGKHIPNHRIMKNLLKNFGSGTKMYIENDQVDTIPTRDTDCAKKCRENCTKIKLDKTTSTSGIVWPVFLRNPQMCDDHPAVRIRNNQSQISHHNFPNKIENKIIDRTKSKIPKRKITMRTKIERRVEKEENRNSDIESNPPNDDITKKSSEGIPRFHVRTREHTYIIEEENVEEKIGTMKGLIKENSFVQTQVEKFNKMVNKKQGKKKSTKALDLQKRNWNLNRNYLGMMTSARSGFPKIEERLLEHTTDNYDWSDTSDTKAEVKFPKETRHAMETIIQKASRCDRTPLSKYLRHQDLDLQPAIPVFQGHQGGQRALSYVKKGSCDRGDCEGLTANIIEEVSSPCRCSDRPMKKHRSRRIPIKCKQ